MLLDRYEDAVAERLLAEGRSRHDEWTRARAREVELREAVGRHWLESIVRRDRLGRFDEKLGDTLAARRARARQRADEVLSRITAEELDTPSGELLYPSKFHPHDAAFDQFEADHLRHETTPPEPEEFVPADWNVGRVEGFTRLNTGDVFARNESVYRKVDRFHGQGLHGKDKGRLVPHSGRVVLLRPAAKEHPPIPDVQHAIGELLAKRHPPDEDVEAVIKRINVAATVRSGEDDLPIGVKYDLGEMRRAKTPEEVRMHLSRAFGGTPLQHPVSGRLATMLRHFDTYVRAGDVGHPGEGTGGVKMHPPTMPRTREEDLRDVARHLPERPDASPEYVKKRKRAIAAAGRPYFSTVLDSARRVA